MTKNQLDILRDIFANWDDEALMGKVNLSFEDVTRTVTLDITDCDDEDYRELRGGR